MQPFFPTIEVAKEFTSTYGGKELTLHTWTGMNKIDWTAKVQEEVNEIRGVLQFNIYNCKILKEKIT